MTRTEAGRWKASWLWQWLWPVTTALSSCGFFCGNLCSLSPYAVRLGARATAVDDVAGGGVRMERERWI
jgi:hypothetical protein